MSLPSNLPNAVVDRAASAPDDDISLSMNEAATRAGISRALLYKFTGNDVPGQFRLQTFCIGRRRIVPLRDFRNWLNAMRDDTRPEPRKAGAS
jgi:hypothetical protein